MPKLIKLTGQTFGRLVVLDRAANIGGQAGWRCRCRCGKTVHVRSDRLRSGLTQSCGCRQRDAVTREIVTYSGAHQRVLAAYGPATDYACHDCLGDAQQWSYDGTDPDEIVVDKRLPDGKTGRVAYSLDLKHYHPRCVPCHRKYDHHSRR